MARIFSVLAVLAVLMLAASFAVGLWIGDFNAAAAQYREAMLRYERLRRDRAAASAEVEHARQAVADAETTVAAPRSRKTLHLYLGVASSLVAILVNSITITYFIGTSRWCKEVCETYHLPSELAARSTQLKRSTFPWAVAGVLAVIAVAALGAAADPSGANFSRSAAWVTPHYLAAITALLVVAWSFWVQIDRIASNYAVIEQIMAEVQRVREKQVSSGVSGEW